MNINELNKVIAKLHDPMRIVVLYQQDLIRIRLSAWNCHDDNRHHKLMNRAAEIRCVIKHIEQMQQQKEKFSRGLSINSEYKQFTKND